MANLGGWEIVIILGVLVLLFGAKRLPDMARSVGQSARVFKGEMKGMRDDGAPPAAPAQPATPTQSAAPPPTQPAAPPSPVPPAADEPTPPRPTQTPGPTPGQ